ncbi:MAG TPA: LLM class flavin-dependent oxidoreductase [Candidatus Binataceae bacterium]|nr:LLM class flavin-dependent oxidoreductase [Candidatus Binataceae bacterium]
MDFGFVFLSTPEAYKDVALAERLGFSHAWLYDSQMLCADVYAALALVAANTKKIKIGPGVTNPSSRIAPVTANAMATINAIAPGRVILGIGTGNTARRTLGMPAAKVSEMREHIDICRGLMAGKTVPYHEGERHRQIKFLNPKTGWLNLKDKIPIYAAASGLKSFEMAGEVADGVIMFGAVGPSLVNFVMSKVRAGAERAGRNPKRIYSLVMTTMHLTRPGEKLESPAVRRAVGPFVVSASNLFALAANEPGELPDDLRADLLTFRDAYRAPDESAETRHLKLYSGYLTTFKKEHERLVTEKMIRETTLTGTPDEVVAAVRRMEKAGINQVAIQPVSDIRKTIEVFAKHVIRPLNRR